MVQQKFIHQYLSIEEKRRKQDDLHNVPNSQKWKRTQTRSPQTCQKFERIDPSEVRQFKNRKPFYCEGNARERRPRRHHGNEIVDSHLYVDFNRYVAVGFFN